MPRLRDEYTRHLQARGVHALNVGNWISRLQPREYTLRATGWVRVVAGAQSLLNVYLLTLWVLAHFGRPFE